MKKAAKEALGDLGTLLAWAEGNDPTTEPEVIALARFGALSEGDQATVASKWIIRVQYRAAAPWPALVEAVAEFFTEKEDKERRKRLFSDLEETMRYGWKESRRGNVLIAFYDPVADTVRTKEVTVKNRFHDIDAVDDAVRVVLG